MSEKSDPEYVPDDAEPWDNRPDAVNDALICSACRTIGNADDLAFLGEPCPRSWYEDDDCGGIMQRLDPPTEWIEATAPPPAPVVIGEDGSIAGYIHLEPIEVSGPGWAILHERIGGETILRISTGMRPASSSQGFDLRAATMFANAILAEVEIAQRNG